MALLADGYPRSSWPSSNMPIFGPPSTSFVNDIEMEDISIPDEEAMDYEITSVESNRPQDPVAQVRQVEEDEKLAISLQILYDSEIHINIGHTFNGREQHNSSSWRPQTRLLEQRLRSVRERLQTVRLLLRRQTPFFAEDSFESMVEISIEIGDKSVGLGKRELNVLPTRKFSSSQSAKLTSNGSSSQDCPVCLAEYENDDILRTLPCCHEFHVACIDQWLKSHNTCPVCRTEIARR